MDEGPAHSFSLAVVVDKARRGRHATGLARVWPEAAWHRRASKGSTAGQACAYGPCTRLDPHTSEPNGRHPYSS
eukprot:gene32383-2575_t